MVTYKFSTNGDNSNNLIFKVKVFGKIDIEYNGQMISNAINAFGVQTGTKSVELPDGKKLELQMKPGLIKNDLIVVLDGKQIGGKSQLDTTTSASSSMAQSIMLTIAGINLIVGLTSMFAAYFQKYGFGLINLFAGIVYMILWYFAAKKRSKTAYIIFFTLFLLDTLLTIVLVIQNGIFNVGIVVRGIFLYQLFLGMKSYGKGAGDSTDVKKIW